MSYDAPLLAAIAGRLARAVVQDMRHRVKQLHLRCLVTDGAYEEQNDGALPANMP